MEILFLGQSDTGATFETILSNDFALLVFGILSLILCLLFVFVFSTTKQCTSGSGKPSNTYAWTWSICLSNSVFVVLYLFIFVFVCLFICVCICDTVTARQWPLLQAPPMLTPCLTASSLLSNLSQIHVLPHIYTYIHLQKQKNTFSYTAQNKTCELRFLEHQCIQI